MKKTTALKAFAITILHFTFSILHFTAQGAVIQQVIVRQQWPWSTDIKVEYKLAEVTAPVDISVKAYNGNVELPLPGEAITGDLYGISESGIGQFVIDPVKAFGNEKVAIADFRVELEVTDSPANMLEALYKIYDLEGGGCTDVTRADLLNGKYGTIETNYAALGKSFLSTSNYTTPVTDVLIWTGVTNSEEYVTTKLVMRKIPAAGQTFTIGSPTTEIGRKNTDKSKVDGVVSTISGRETQHSVTLTKDFYLGVFEVTQYQWWKIMGAWPSAWSLVECRNARPVEKVSYDNIRGTGIGSTWPTNATHAVLSTSFLGKLRAALDGSPKLDLPTEAQWEYACRAKQTAAWYTGYSPADTYFYSNPANLRTCARFIMNGGYVTNAYPKADHYTSLGTTNGTARVGSYLPNAYGLYDMLGNVGEWCLDWFGMFTADAETDPLGPSYDDAPPSEYGFRNRVLRCANYVTDHSTVRAAMRGHNTWSSSDSNSGFRLCLTVEE